MTDELIRQFTPELEIRAAAQGGDGRTIVGLAVPFGRPQRINATLTEQFARGAFNHQLRAASRVRFAREHLSLGGSLIGRTMLLRDDAAGLYGEFRVSKTPVGEETLELVKDGALTDLSIGFRERQNRRMPDGTIERTSADLREVSVVMEGAYGANAVVAEVRHAGDPDAPCPHCGHAPTVEHRAVAAGLPPLPPLPAL